MDEPVTMPTRSIQKPSVGRIVHFYEWVKDKWKGPTAAMITAAYQDDSVCLTLFYPGDEGHIWQVYPKPSIESLSSSSITPVRYYWEWPPRV